MNVLLNVYICPLRKNSLSLLPKGPIKCTQLAPYNKFTGIPIKINKNGAIARSKNISGTSDTRRHFLKDIYNNYILMKRHFYFLFYVDNILVVCKCIRRKFLIFTFMSKSCFQIFVAMGDTGCFFLRNNDLWTIQASLTKLQGSWR